MDAAEVSKTVEENGEFFAAGDIISRYGDFIRGVIRTRVNDSSIVGDIFQDFYLSLHAKPVPTNVVRMKSYLYRRICNEIADAYRAISRHRRLLDKYSEYIEKTVNNDASDCDFRYEADKVLERAKTCLSQREHQAIVMRYKKSCAIQEVAAHMGVRRESVSRYLCVGLGKIRQLMERSNWEQETENG